MSESQNNIQFILDEKIISIDFNKQGLSPTLTVLNYLRSLPTHKGVKEGCAEGDCEACTVIIAELKKDKSLTYKAINSCLVFLPMLHGKQLITVENLAEKERQGIKLHPVQKAIVDLNGSQCGYCTPGIVMTMFALYKNYQNPEREIIEDALTGNLCRCTGYQPIIKAAQKACQNGNTDQFSKREKKTISLLNMIDKKPVSIITSNQKYFQPIELQAIFKLLEEHPNTAIINGSTDIALKQTKKFEVLEEIIDLSKIEELKIFKETGSEFIIGSGLPLESIRDNVSDQLPAFTNMLNDFASKQIRNVATLGGNIGTASPIGDSIPLLVAYNAKLKLINRSGERQISIEEFIKGYRKTDLQKGEIIHSVIIPKPTNQIIRFYKVSKRKDLDISTLSAGFRLELSDNKVTDVCLAFGGMAEIAKRATSTEKFLLNKEWSFENIKKAAKILKEEFKPISDARSGSEFRKIAAKNLLIKFYEETKHTYASA